MDMSESQSDDDAAGEEEEDYHQNGEDGEHSEAHTPVEFKPKPSRKLDLPANLDADLYGLRRSVSLFGLSLASADHSRGIGTGPGL